MRSLRSSMCSFTEISSFVRCLDMLMLMLTCYWAVAADGTTGCGCCLDLRLLRCVWHLYELAQCDQSVSQLVNSQMRKKLGSVCFVHSL